MSLLEHPQALALLADAEVSVAAVCSCRRRLPAFLGRYLPWFYRREQCELAEVVLQGKLSGLERKTSEPIAYAANRHRKPVQHFVGAGAWDDEAVAAELRRHVAFEAGDPQAVLVLDGSGFPKKGTASCGVARQWCNRLGKLDNCQVGLFLGYVGCRGSALVDRRLYLPRDWADDPERREQTHVPEAVAFQESWRIGLGMIDRSRVELPFGWVAGDDEFGRPSEFRAGLRAACVTCSTCRATRWCGTSTSRRPRASVIRRGVAPTSGRGCSRSRGGVGWSWRRGPRAQPWSGLRRPGCRPRMRAAASGPWSGWW